MIKKIVFFSFSPIVKKIHYKRFGLEVLKENGFETWIYDFSPIVHPILHNTVIHRIEKIISEDYFLFYDEVKAIQAIHGLGEDCFVVVTSYYCICLNSPEIFEQYFLPLCFLPFFFVQIGSLEH